MSTRSRFARGRTILAGSNGRLGLPRSYHLSRVHLTRQEVYGEGPWNSFTVRTWLVKDPTGRTVGVLRGSISGSVVAEYEEFVSRGVPLDFLD